MYDYYRRGVECEKSNLNYDFTAPISIDPGPIIVRK